MATVRHPKASAFVQQRLFAGLSNFTELEQRISKLPDEKSRGDALEVFAEAYLATQRKHDAETVWPLAAVPVEVLGSLQLTVQDFGVDGVLKTRLGKFSAYQVKFRAGRPALTWRELSTFMALADSPNIHTRILLTNCDELPPVLNDRRGFFCIRGSDLDRLETEDFKTIEAWPADSVHQAPRKTPLPHQTEALQKILPAFKEHDRLSAIMACGTGKTLVALWVAEHVAQASTPAGSGGVSPPVGEHAPGRCLNPQPGTAAPRILVLLPSLALLRQTLHEWLRETSFPSLAYLCVCSDPTVKEGTDALVTAQSDLDFEVSTEPASVRAFLDADFAGVKIIFSTYQSAAVVGQALKGGEMFDLGIFDEAHKTAGREGRNFAFALEDKNLPIRKRLFLTATPRHYNALNKNKEGEAQLVFSMDNQEVYGPQTFRLTFADAANRKPPIICRYKVVISVITSQQVTNELLSRGEVLVNGDAIRARQVANQIALKDAIEKYGVNKVFTFHSTVASAESFTSRGNEGVATHLSEFKSLHVNGAMPTAKRERIMREFRECRRGVISNARCLTEGVDVPAVDMVAFLAPRRSRVDIVQATGRAMRKAEGKTIGYVLVPLYVEQAANETVERAVLRSDFSEVWEVLQSLQEQDEVLAEIIRDMRMERGRTKGYDDARFREIVPILGPSVSLDVLRQSITAACLDAIGEKWFERYGQLLEYRTQHGNCDMPARWAANQKLATWVVNQRVLQKEGKLEEEKINLLNRLGFQWSPHETTWREQYLALMDYKRRFGDCNVPQNWKENRSLSHWIKTQRMDYKHGDISRERIALLEKIGFEWWIGLPTWDHRFAELCAYKEKYKHTSVPIRWPENPLLGRWVSSQRYKRTAGILPKDFEERLNSINFEWKAPNASQDEMPIEKRIESLVAHKAEYGHWAVSLRNPKYPGLGRWVANQRARFRKGIILGNLKGKLDAIGFPWKPEPPNTDKLWFENFNHYKAYAAANGVRMVKVVDGETRKLNDWILTQRHAKKNGKLSDVRIHALDEIGFVWQIKGRKSNAMPSALKPTTKPLFRPWDEMFSELAEFFKLHGHCNVEADWAANPELARWVDHQRIAKRQNRLAVQQVQRMEELGFAWTSYDGDWDAMFAKLAAYLRPTHHGKPRNVVASLELKRWMLTQRQLKKRGELEPGREQKLTSIGFEWQPYSRQWDEMFDALQKFRAEKGHCRVPGRWSKNPKLASWVATQRARKAAGKLSPERISKLDELGFVWRVYSDEAQPSSEAPAVHEIAWQQMLGELVAYKNEHGNCKVPAQWPRNPKLARWVATQRQSKKSGKIKPERNATLNAIGFEWVIGRGQAQARSLRQGVAIPNAQLWEERFRALEQYKQAHGNCLVPRDWKQNRRLADWVTNQRMAHKRKLLDADLVRRLDALGFDWDPVTNKWEEMFQQLVEFKRVHGHTNVPQHSGEYEKLANWVRNQRAAKRYEYPIMAERAKRLEEIGFVWLLVEPNSWESMFDRLVEYKMVNGNCDVPQHYPQDKRLGKWVNTQRTTFKRGKIQPDRKRQLDSIGFAWNLRPNLVPVR